MTLSVKSISFICAAFLLCSQLQAVEIVAHRGASHDAPENTLASFRLGYQQNADACELDIHLTSDGKIAVIHDYDAKRVAGVNKKVVEQTFDEIRSLNAGAWGAWQGKGFTEKIPTLDEVLAIVPDGKKLLIEIKCGPEVLPALEESINRSHKKPGQLVIITFHYEVAKAAKERFPQLMVYWLAGWSKNKTTGEYPRLEDLMQQARDAHLDGLDLDYHFPLDRAAISKMKNAGLQCHVWTVDDPEAARRLADAGVASITTNRPEWLREQLRSR